MTAAGRTLVILGVLILATFVADGGAADSPATGYIVVTNPPVADFFASTRYGSAPFTVSFSDNSRGGAPDSWLWEFGDGTTSRKQNPSHTYTANGIYDVRLTVTNAYGKDVKTVPAYIGVGGPLIAEFSASAADGPAPLTVTFFGGKQDVPAIWFWDFGDGSFSYDQNPVHTFMTPGNYMVRLRTGINFGVEPVTSARFIVVTGPGPTPAPSPAEPEVRRLTGIPGLIHAAKGNADKDVPAAGIIPPQFMALAAMLTSLAVVLVHWLVLHAGALWQFLSKFVDFLAGLFGEHAAEKLSEREIAARRLAARKLEPHFIGLSSTEILVVEGAVIIVALAFILADRAELTLTTVLIYMAVGGISVVLHDFAHRFIVTSHGADADTRFWGLGTFIMFVTAWLFGNAFALSYRNLVNREGDIGRREEGLEMVAGPAVSVILMGVSLALVSLGGTWAVAGGIGFTVNLMTALYSLMPIDTMDGPAIWRWNRGIYLTLLIPVFAFYVYTYVIIP